MQTRSQTKTIQTNNIIYINKKTNNRNKNKNNNNDNTNNKSLKNKNTEALKRAKLSTTRMLVWDCFKRKILMKAEKRKEYASKSLCNKDIFKAKLMKEVKRERNDSNLRNWVSMGRLASEEYEIVEEMYQYWNSTLNPSSSICIKATNEHGLGVFSNEQTSLGQNQLIWPDDLWGTLFPITEKEYRKLEANKFDSMYCNNLVARESSGCGKRTFFHSWRAIEFGQSPLPLLKYLYYQKISSKNCSNEDIPKKKESKISICCQ